MTAVEERSETAKELYSHVPLQYRPTLEQMFFFVPTAKAHFEVGNVHTAFELLRDASVEIHKGLAKINKDTMLAYIMQALPSMYQIGDMDPGFEPTR